MTFKSYSPVPLIVKQILIKSLCGISLIFSGPLFAVNAASFTLDNDVFVGDDNGYTNGIYVSVYHIGNNVKENFWVRPLMWTMPSGTALEYANVHSFGQVLTTAEDITVANPAEDDLPYSGLLQYTNAHVKIGQYYADWVSTTLGLVGPSAKGKQTQTDFHKLIGAKKPMGWDTQLKDEVVFAFSRGHVTRLIASPHDNFDFLVGGQLGVGTLKSAVNAGAMIRLGKNLKSSFATVLLASSRASNPLALDNSWFIYTGAFSTYVFNQIFTDGNTFRDSRSIDYDHSYNVFVAGLSTSLGNGASLTFAYQTSFSEDESVSSYQTEKLNKFGTLTLAWQF
ncbi:lipid A deacylase LpxR family protein [Marinomonas sp. THO17]|uniref:lipid A deacylase LpxR family protein n=1 Tax=Marinomonas sp. THO17 TaxID=3149048 RepID=UPI00336BCAC0